MRKPILLCLFAAAVAPAFAAEPVSAFPRRSWFVQHFAAPRTKVELQAPRRLSDYVVEGKLELSLRAYIELVLANNTDIALARLQVETPANAITRAYSPFDPSVSASFSSTQMTETSINALQGASTIKIVDQPWNSAYSQLLPSGTGLSVGFYADRSSTNYAYNTYNPVLSSNLSVQFQHQLLRDRGAVMEKMSILVARSTLRIGRYQLRDQVTGLIANAENVYWNVVEARETEKLAGELVALKAASLERAQKQVDLSALLPLDIFQPKSEYASARLSQIQAKLALSQQENALRQQIGADLDPAIRDLPISLTEPLSIPVVQAPDKAEAVRKAMAARPDRLALAAALDTDDLNIRRANEALRPAVSLFGLYETQGIGGTYLPAAIPGGFGDALSQVFHFRFPVYQFGLQMKLPIRDHAAAADLADAGIKKKADALSLRKLEQTLRLQVLNAVDNVEAARAGLEQAQLARDYAGQRFESEQKKYELGISLLPFLQESQTAFNSAENNVLEQNINYRRNLVNLYVIMGQLLDERGITLD
jgi:outer membrane protein TolC